MTSIHVVMILVSQEHLSCVTMSSCFPPPGFSDTHVLVFLLTHRPLPPTPVQALSLLLDL